MCPLSETESEFVLEGAVFKGTRSTACRERKMAESRQVFKIAPVFFKLSCQAGPGLKPVSGLQGHC